MAKKKLLDTLIDLAKRPNKEMARIKRKRKAQQSMKEQKSKDEKALKNKKERDKFFSDESITARRKEVDAQTKAYAVRMEREFAKSNKISPSKMKGGGIAIKGYGKAFSKGNK
jgi:hypothetical protein